MNPIKIGSRISLWGDDPAGKGVIIGGPDKVGNYKVRWDKAWDGENVTEECIDTEDVVESSDAKE